MRQRLQRWLDLWEDEETAVEVTPSLGRHLERLTAGVVREASVLVPLCGKSFDLVWLAEQGLQVVGVECSRRVIASFASEQGLELSAGDATEPSSEKGAGAAMTAWFAGPCTIFEGDWFDVTPTMLGGEFDFAYDHAALTAVDPKLRGAYAAALSAALRPTGRLLVVAAEFDEASADSAMLALGPHSLGEQELRELFPGFGLEVLEEGPAESVAPYRRLQAAGVAPITQRTFLLERGPDLRGLHLGPAA